MSDPSDGATQNAPEAKRADGWRPSPRMFVALLVVGVILGLWRTGTLDHALVNVGLNAQECARNGFGATLCGDELREYRERVVRPLEDARRREEEEARAAEDAARREEEDNYGYCLDGSREGPDGCPGASP